MTPGHKLLPVKLPVFEGPLDLLLHLIERHELDISAVSLVLVVVIMAVVFSLLSNRFADYDNLRNILLQSAATTIGAVGMTFVIVTRGDVDQMASKIWGCKS